MPNFWDILTGRSRSVNTVTRGRQVFVDVSVLYRSDAGTGIQRVVKTLYKLLMAQSSGLEVRPVYATRWRRYRLADPAFLDGSRRPAHTSERIVPQNGDIFLGLDLAAHVLPRHKAQLRQWKRRGLHIYLFVYDLLPITRPEWFNTKTSANFRRWFKVLTKFADGVICISDHVRLETQKETSTVSRKNPLDLRVVRLGAEIEPPARSTDIACLPGYIQQNLRNSKPILMVGTLEPRKAYESVLDAFDRIWDEHPLSDLSLVIVGRRGWKTESLQKRIVGHAQFNSRLFWFDNADDALLVMLYDLAWGLLMASFDEGFGLPVIEAAHHGKPILARDIAVFREIAPPETSFFRADATAVGLAESIMQWTEKTYELNKDGMSKLYSWQNSIEDLLSIIRSIPLKAL